MDKYLLIAAGLAVLGFFGWPTQLAERRAKSPGEFRPGAACADPAWPHPVPDGRRLAVRVGRQALRAWRAARL